MFISYRREDAPGFAGRVHDSLASRFGRDRIFRDRTNIEPGADYGELIDRSVAECGAFVAIIGERWLVDDEGRRRLFDPDDWVRREVLAAITRGILVVPVLVEGVKMPAEADLPEPISAIARYQAIEITDARWDYDVGRLSERIGTVVDPAPTPRLRRWLVPTTARGAALRLVTLGAAALLLSQVLVPALVGTSSPPRMTGDFNIAVAEFGAIDGRGQAVESPEALALAQSVHDQLRDELASIRQSGFDLQLLPPSQAGVVTGATRDQRARTAVTTLDRLNADIILYGTLVVGTPTQFRPEFFVRELRLDDAKELFGQHELGSVVTASGDISQNPVIRRDFRDPLLARMHALAEFIVGLSYYALNDTKGALEHFQIAEAATGWNDADGKEVLYLFLGNAAGSVGHLDQAEESYAHALALNEEYSRARLGLAEVTFQRARGSCEAGMVQPDGLQRALEMFQGVQAAQAQPALSDIPTKIVYGSARVQACRSQALLVDAWDEAEAGFRQVVTEYEKGNQRIRELAAESHAGLGLAALPAAGDADATARFRVAAGEYDRAVELTRRNDRKAFFLSMKGFILGRLGDIALADDAYRQAIDLEPEPAVKTRYDQARQALPVPP